MTLDDDNSCDKKETATAFNPQKSTNTTFDKWHERYSLYQNSHFVNKNNSRVYRPPSSKFAYNEVRKQYCTNPRTNRAPVFEKQTRRKSHEVRSEVSEYCCEIYDGAEQGRLKLRPSRNGDIPRFDQRQGRDNLMYRINEGNNLDELLREKDSAKENRTLKLANMLIKSSQKSCYHSGQLQIYESKPTLEEKILSGYYKV